MYDRRFAAAFFVAFWCLYAQVGPGPTTTNPNTVTRLGMVHALVGEGRARIDTYADATPDKARFGDGWYLDKAPGLSFMALPIVEAASLAAGSEARADPARLHALDTPFWTWTAWAAGALTVAPATAAAAAAIYLLARRWRCSVGGAMFASVAFAVCTPAFGWSTVFFGHAMAGACALLAFALVVAATGAQRGRAGAALAAGFLLGWTVVVEYTSAPAVGVIGLYALWRLRPFSAPRRARLIAAAVAGGLFAGVPLLAYNLVVFGSVTHVAYSDVVGFDGMRRGLFGITTPNPIISWRLLFGQKRGLLWLSPLLAAVPVAWWMARRAVGWPALSVLLAVPATYLVINSGYEYWDGGWSTGPRHLVPALPFLCLPLGILYDRAGRTGRGLLMTLAAVSFGLSLACASVDMASPSRFGAPLVEHILPEFAAGQVHNLLFSLGTPAAASVSATLLIALAVGAAAYAMAFATRRAAIAAPGHLDG